MDTINPTALLQTVGLKPDILTIDATTTETSILSLDPAYTKDLDGFDAVTRAHGENILAKLRLKELQKNAEWILILTDKGLYKFELDAPLNQPRKRKDLIDFYDVEADSSDPRMFTTKLYKSNMKTAVKSSFMKFMGNLGSKVDLESIFQRREYICQSPMQRDQFVFVMNRAIRNRWQRMLEDHVIPEPEYYQMHQLVIKINRKGVHQERLIVLSNEWMYNIEISHNPSKVEEIKWCVPITCLEAVSIDYASTETNFFFDNHALRDFVSDMKSKGIKRKDVITKNNDTYNFEFVDDLQRAAFVAVIRHLFKKNVSDGRKLKLLTSNDHAAIGLLPSVVNESSGPGSPPPLLTIPEDDYPQIPEDDIPGAPAFITEVEFANKPLIVESLEKILNGTTKSHSKTFALYPDMTIKWGNSATKFKHSAKIISVMNSLHFEDDIPEEKRPRFFALRTTQKPLLLIAPTGNSKASWVTVVESLMTPLLTADTPRNNGKAAFESSIPIIKGPMTKYIKNGKDKHIKYFCLYEDKTIRWGDSMQSLKHRATVEDIDQDISELGFIAREEAVRFVRVKTSDKTLEMLCPNQDSADRWVSVISHLLNPDFEDDNDDDEEFEEDN